MGRLAGALIRTFLWLSAELLPLAGMAPLLVQMTGTLARVLATVPPHLLFGFLFISVVSSGADCWSCDYGGWVGPPCVGAFDPNFPLAFC